MQQARIRRMQAVRDLFKHELGLKYPKVERVVHKALDRGYARALVNEVMNQLILEGRIPADTPSVWLIAA